MFTFAQALFVVVAAGDLVERAFGFLHRQRSQRQHVLHQRVQGRVPASGIAHRLEQAKRLQLRHAERPRRQEGAFGCQHTEAAHVALQAAGVVMQAERRGRHAPLHAIQTDAQVTRQHDVGRAAVYAAVEGADRDGPQARQPVRNPFEEGGAVAVFVKAADVKTRTEHRLGLACSVGGQHQHAHAGVALYSVKVFQQPLQVAVFKFVALGWAVQGDGGHAIRNLQDRGTGLGKNVGHGWAAKEKGVRRRLWIQGDADIVGACAVWISQ